MPPPPPSAADADAAALRERLNPTDAGDLGAARALGARLRRELDGWQLPLLAVETTYSLLRGTATPAAWSAALAALHPPGHQGAWAALADRDDLAGLPTTLRAWGRERMAVGATVELAAAVPGGADCVALLLAPDAGAYAQLCRLLSWRHEDPAGWLAWAHGATPAVDPAGVVVLLDDEAWALRLAGAGVAVHWRWDLRPRLVPPAVLARGVTAVAAPLLTHLDHRGQDRHHQLLEHVVHPVSPGTPGVEGVLRPPRE